MMQICPIYLVKIIVKIEYIEWLAKLLENLSTSTKVKLQ